MWNTTYQWNKLTVIAKGCVVSWSEVCFVNQTCPRWDKVASTSHCYQPLLGLFFITRPSVTIAPVWTTRNTTICATHDGIHKRFPPQFAYELMHFDHYDTFLLLLTKVGLVLGTTSWIHLHPSTTLWPFWPAGSSLYLDAVPHGSYWPVHQGLDQRRANLLKWYLWSSCDMALSHTVLYMHYIDQKSSCSFRKVTEYFLNTITQYVFSY